MAISSKGRHILVIINLLVTVGLSLFFAGCNQLKGERQAESHSLPATIPPPGTNNFWYSYNERSDTVIIFVHGIFSDSRDCWLNKSMAPATYWPQIANDDKRFGSPS